MNRDPVEITPYTITEVKTVKYFNIQIGSVELFTKADIRILLLNENKQVIDYKDIELTGQDYLDWKDDSYIIDKVKQILASSQ